MKRHPTSNPGSLLYRLRRVLRVAREQEDAERKLADVAMPYVRAALARTVIAERLSRMTPLGVATWEATLATYDVTEADALHAYESGAAFGLNPDTVLRLEGWPRRDVG